MYEHNPELELRRQSFLRRRRLIRLTSLGICCLLVIFICVYFFTDAVVRLSPGLESAPGNGEWTMFRHDPARTGSTEPVGKPQGRLKWTFTTGAAIHSSPTVVDGVVYCGSQDGRLYALDAATGAKLWEFPTGSWVESSPAVVSGVVYFGSNDGHLYALDAATGARLWDFPARYAVRSSPAVADGAVYFGADDWRIYALDAATGAELWSREVKGTVISSPVVTRGVVAAGSLDGFFYALDARPGRVRLEFQTKTTITASPAAADGTAYFATSTGVLYAVDITARNWPLENRLKIFWEALYLYRAAPRPPPPSGFLWSARLAPGGVSSPALVDGVLYLGTGSGVAAVDTATRQVRWDFPTGVRMSSSPAVAGNVVYIGGEDGRLYALDRSTGVKLWDYLTGDKITSSPALAGGILYVGSHDGTLYAFE
ncbi:MAG: PQQ-binding-like beta-propeller repeat protein [Chloroflexota bacterium]